MPQFFKQGSGLKAWGVLIFDQYAEKDAVSKYHQLCSALELILVNRFMAQFQKVLAQQGKSYPSPLSTSKLT
jgi:hypothetical protein